MTLNERAAEALWDDSNGEKSVKQLREELIDSEPRKISLVDHIASGHTCWAYRQYGTVVYRARTVELPRSKYDKKGGPPIKEIELEAADGFYPHVSSWRKILGVEEFLKHLNDANWFLEIQAP